MVTALFREGISALPLHDSVLVAAPRAGRAKALMVASFELVAGLVGAFVKVEESPN
jgi:hypothetical protein